MIRKVTLIFLSFSALAFAAGLPISNPAEPVEGEKISWTVSSFDRETENPVMLLAVYFPDTVIPEIIRGESTSQGWEFTYTIPEGASFAAYKIEDDTGNLLDDEGFHFGVLIYDESGKVKFNSNLYNAVLYYDSQMQNLDMFQEKLKDELEAHPENWTAFLLLREVQMEKGEITLVSLIDELDSLIATEPDSMEALLFVTMGFKLSSQMLVTEGEKLLLTCAEKYPESGYWTRNQELIYNAFISVPGRMENYERTIFPLLKGEARKAAYLTIIGYHVESHNIEKAEEFISVYFTEFPSAKLPTAGIMNLLRAKYPQPSSEWAAEVEEWYKKHPDDLDLPITLAYYYKDRDWKKSTSYFRKAIKSMNSPQAVIQFAEAAAEKGKNFAESKKNLQKILEDINMERYRKLLIMEDFTNRRKVLMANTALAYNTLGLIYLKSGEYETAVKNLLLADSFQTLIPGYEKTVYQRLLEASEKAGDLEGRKIAILNILATEGENQDLTVAISDIYALEYGSKEGFKNWLGEETRKIALRFRLDQPLRDFSLADEEGDTVRLSDFKGKVVVMNFWGTWCGPCKQEIPELNNLVKFYQDSDEVVFIAIANEPEDTVTAFLKETPFDYQLHYELPSMEATRIFQIQSVPTHLVIDKRGYLQYQHVGSTQGLVESLIMEIDALIK